MAMRRSELWRGVIYESIITNESADTGDTVHEATAIAEYNDDLSFIKIPEKVFILFTYIATRYFYYGDRNVVNSKHAGKKEMKKTSGGSARRGTQQAESQFSHRQSNDVISASKFP
ncbi:hypothetical protein [Enterobacter sp. ECC-019]|uniref:hypothetical protein n=1 Tax=Enterobacter sp. ECC-019 TaxID=3116478 RepID=UPI0037544AC0